MHAQTNSGHAPQNVRKLHHDFCDHVIYHQIEISATFMYVQLEAIPPNIVTYVTSGECVVDVGGVGGGVQFQITYYNSGLSATWLGRPCICS